MQKDTASMAKNKIKRSLNAICDPHPTKSEENTLWEYFDEQCAYCGKPIERNSRTGHLDHLISSAEGGSNSIYNHALSCATCNGDEKREESWHSFLSRRARSAEALKARRSKIEQWLAKVPQTICDQDFASKRDRIIQEALENFDASVKKMRELRANDT